MYLSGWDKSKSFSCYYKAVTFCNFVHGELVVRGNVITVYYNGIGNGACVV